MPNHSRLLYRPTCNFENAGTGTCCHEVASIQEWSGKRFCIAHGMPIVTRWAVPWRPIPVPAEYGYHQRLWHKLARIHHRTRCIPTLGGRLNLLRKYNPLMREARRLRVKLMREQQRIIDQHRRRSDAKAVAVVAMMQAAGRLDSARIEARINAYEHFRDTGEFLS